VVCLTGDFNRSSLQLKTKTELIVELLAYFIDEHFEVSGWPASLAYNYSRMCLDLLGRSFRVRPKIRRARIDCAGRIMPGFAGLAASGRCANAVRRTL
jgi:hypothetical protein